MLVLVTFDGHAVAFQHFSAAQPTIPEVYLVVLHEVVFAMESHHEIVGFLGLVGGVLCQSAVVSVWDIIVADRIAPPFAAVLFVVLDDQLSV